MDAELEKLAKSAREGMSNAYCPRTHFPVGAAVLTSTGSIFHGCNVESVISGLGTCAERSAIDHAIAHGEYRFRAIATVSGLDVPIHPCGACLQYIAEFAQVGESDITIYMLGASGEWKESTINTMLPQAFGPSSLELDLSRYR
ncbi:MAG: cytidine deaminase [Planctomycetes bacterium]|nr:cytidine deaminase [Planctomycetota bacterium]